jgi:hypothetical protein
MEAKVILATALLAALTWLLYKLVVRLEPRK